MKRRPVKTVKEGGKALVRVPIGPNEEKDAEIWRKDFEYLLSIGMSGNFNRVNGDYVIASASKAIGAHVMVARVLLDAGPGETVKYLDNNPLNLRHENLRVETKAGGSTRRDRDYVLGVEAA